MEQRFTGIVARDLGYVIGDHGEIPWYILEDMMMFKKLTQHNVVIMGRKTYDSIPGPLPKRKNVVLSRDAEFVSDGDKIVVRTLEEACAAASTTSVPFIIGGEAIYKLFMPYCYKFYETVVETYVDGDAYFPKLDCREWKSRKVIAQSVVGARVPWVTFEHTRKM
jgi:dihydrofolate reductase